MKADIAAFQSEQRIHADRSNRSEFVDTEKVELGNGCSRTSPASIDRKLQMKTAVVDNSDGPLIKSVNQSLLYPFSELETHQSGGAFFCAAEERIRNLETHLGIVTVPIDKNLYERIKIVEDKILKIEQHYPQIAAHCFNYGKAEVDASYRPKGRVSHYFQEEKSRKRRKQIKAEETKAMQLDDSSLQSLKNRMAQLKERLLSGPNS
jgi:hypothetical protein